MQKQEMRKKRIKKQMCNGIIKIAGISSCCGGAGGAGGCFPVAAEPFRAWHSPSSPGSFPPPPNTEKGSEEEEEEEDSIF